MFERRPDLRRIIRVSLNIILPRSAPVITSILMTHGGSKQPELVFAGNQGWAAHIILYENQA
ncbi:MAG TPA: hypothetical protein VKV95_01430 [Terriglobia bacterium]|nr:hypothetical protein [Terriglobia bacterium]